MSTRSRSPKRALTVGLALLCATALAAPAFAKKSEEERAAHFAERLSKMEIVVKERIAPELKLDEGQTERLVQTMQSVTAQRHAAKQTVHQEAKKLKELLDAGANDGQLSEQMARLKAARDEMPQRGALLDETSRFLTVQQQAKLTLMLPKMMKERGHKRFGKHGKHGKRGKRGFGDEGRRGFEGADSDF